MNVRTLAPAAAAVCALGAAIPASAAVRSRAGAPGTPGAATIAATAGLPRPALAPPSGAYLIPTPAGKRLVVAAQVTYSIGALVKTRVPRSRLTARLNAIARLPGGAVFRANDALQVAGASSRVLEHHLFFTAAQTRKILAAGKRIRLQLNAVEALDVNGDGHDDAQSSAVRSSFLPAISAPSADSDTLLGHAMGADPCGYYNLTQCLDVAGSTWTAHHFWASNTQVVDCPPTGYPYTNQDTTTDTSSNHYTETTWIFTGDTAAHITITDDNIHGHPYTYQPWIACTVTDPGGGSGPYVQ